MASGEWRLDLRCAVSQLRWGGLRLQSATGAACSLGQSTRPCWRISISVLVLILTLVSTGRGRRIRLASKIPFYLL